MNSGIYQIKNQQNGRVYIGSTSNLTQRKSDHFKMLRKGTHKCRHLQNAFTKHGEESFEFIILVRCEIDELLRIEQALMDVQIAQHGRQNLYNSSPWAARIRHTEEAKELIRQSKLGKKNPFYGKKHTPETCTKMSVSRMGRVPWNLGKKATQQHRDNIAKGGIGRRHTQETKMKMSNTHKQMVADGQLWTSEHRENLAIAQRRRRERERELRTDL